MKSEEKKKRFFFVSDIHVNLRHTYRPHAYMHKIKHKDTNKTTKEEAKKQNTHTKLFLARAKNTKLLPFLWARKLMWTKNIEEDTQPRVQFDTGCFFILFFFFLLFLQLVSFMHTHVLSYTDGLSDASVAGVAAQHCSCCC